MINNPDPRGHDVLRGAIRARVAEAMCVSNRKHTHVPGSVDTDSSLLRNEHCDVQRELLRMSHGIHFGKVQNKSLNGRMTIAIYYIPIDYSTKHWTFSKW